MLKPFDPRNAKRATRGRLILETYTRHQIQDPAADQALAVRRLLADMLHHLHEVQELGRAGFNYHEAAAMAWVDFVEETNHEEAT